MRKLLVLSLVVMFVFGLVFVTGCKKEATTDKPATDKPADDATDKPADDATDKPADDATDKPADDATDKPADDKPADE